MSSSSVCQGFQTCLDPVTIEPRVIRLKLAPPTSKFSSPIADKPETESRIEEKNGGDHEGKSPKCGWSFLQLLTNSSSDKESDNENESVYVHPLQKRSSSALCEKSLKMCTESLGSESGSDVSESNDVTISVNSLLEPSREEVVGRSRESFVTRRTSRNVVCYPPPLTSVSGSSGVQVRSRREGGRLVLEAVTMSSSRAYFHAERSNGRLRLSLFRNCSSDDHNQAEQVEETEEYDMFNEEEKGRVDNEQNDEAEEEEEKEEEEEEVYRGEGIEGNNRKVRGENAEEKLRRLTRCKDGGRENKGLISNYSEQFWVTT